MLYYSIRASFELQLIQRDRSLSEGKVERIDPSRLLIGSQGEILDMTLIPQRESKDYRNSDSFKLALITNSTQVRIVDDKNNCAVLEGHNDIVLCVDVTPDG